MQVLTLEYCGSSLLPFTVLWLLVHLLPPDNKHLPEIVTALFHLTNNNSTFKTHPGLSALCYIFMQA